MKIPFQKRSAVLVSSYKTIFANANKINRCYIHSQPTEEVFSHDTNFVIVAYIYFG